MALYDCRFIGNMEAQSLLQHLIHYRGSSVIQEQIFEFSFKIDSISVRMKESKNYIIIIMASTDEFKQRKFNFEEMVTGHHIYQNIWTQVGCKNCAFKWQSCTPRSQENI